MCGRDALARVHIFTAPPAGETDFGLAPYRRELWRCEACGHVVNRHAMPLERLYDAAYADATYGARMGAAFDRIMALPAARSDNRQRVARVNAFAEAHAIGPPRRALDVGSGLGVFPAALAACGWTCVAIDPDLRAATHIAARTDAEARHGDFMAMTPEPGFDLVAFNKVLEHVTRPVAMLARATDWLSPRGVVYVELPDAEAALADGPAREEFFIEHLAAYSPASFDLLAGQAGLRALAVERLREPSGKYTLFAFLVRP